MTSAKGAREYARRHSFTYAVIVKVEVAGVRTKGTQNGQETLVCDRMRVMRSNVDAARKAAKRG